MTEQAGALGARRRRHRRGHPGRPGPQRQHHERRATPRRWASASTRWSPDREDITGVIITSAKKTFFAGGDLDCAVQGRRRTTRPRSWRTPWRSRRQFRQAGDAGPAGGRGDERHRARRRPGDRAGLPPPHRARRQGRGVRPARGHARPAARRRRRRADHPDAGHPGRVHEGARPGAAAQAGRGAGDRHRRRAGRHARGDAGQGPRLDRGQPRRGPALGPAGLPDPRRHPVHPEAGRGAAGVPGQPAQAAQGRPDAGAAQHPGRGRRGHPGRHRHRVPDRGPLLHRAGLRAGRRRT